MSTRYLAEGGAVLRSRPTFWFVVCVEALLAAMVISLVVMHGPLALVTAALPWYLLGYALWWFLAFPCVRLDEHLITVVNPVRTHRLKYADLIDVQTRFGLHLVTRNRRIQAIGAPAGGAASAALGYRETQVPHSPHLAYRGEGASLMPSDLRNTASGSAAELIRGHWQEQLESGTLRGPEAEPVSTYNLRQLAVLCVLAVATVLHWAF